MAKQKHSKPDGKQGEKKELVSFAFTRQNYRLLIIGIVVITVGFLLMLGGGSEDPKVFNDNMFNFQRLTLGPILVLAGYVIELIAILHKPKQ